MILHAQREHPQVNELIVECTKRDPSDQPNMAEVIVKLSEMYLILLYQTSAPRLLLQPIIVDRLYQRGITNRDKCNNYVQFKKTSFSQVQINYMCIYCTQQAFK